MRVASIGELSPWMARVVLHGEDLDGFSIDAPASSVRLLLPPPGRKEIVMPEWTGNQFELPDGSRAPIRTFTPRLFDDRHLELTIDVVLHERGAASDWVRGATVGAETAVSGPGRSEPLDPHARAHLLAGDETAIPAIGQLLEAIPEDQAVDVHVEIGHTDARVELPVHPRASVTWHDTQADPDDTMVAAVKAVDDLPDAVWIAGEAAAVQRLRRYLFDERGRSRSGVTARGYWKRGRSAD